MAIVFFLILTHEANGLVRAAWLPSLLLAGLSFAPDPFMGIILFSPFSVLFPERDAFDTLFDHAPDKLNVVKKVREATHSLLLAQKGPLLLGF